ncbi:ROK family glucokinase [Lachnoclostridium sp. Marseille-P6806]|uniref:ROK family glucokinase n=1 Tax=Lachnoclostridium sp. Marseille-P6806 TaxID=2364793 RepID=UPI002ED1858C
MNCVFGVDVGGTTVKIGMFDKDGNKQSVWEIPTRTGDQGIHILPDIAEAISGKLEKEGLDKEDVIGIGIGVPGPVDSTGTVHRAVNLGWGTFNIRETMEGLTGIKTAAGNDANVAALGECWKGGGKGYRDMVMVTLGTGVGGGIIIGGKLVAGADGAGGEIGHLHLEDDEKEACNCGHYGCFEEYASATGVVRIGRRILEKSKKKSVLHGLSELSSKDIFDAAVKGDEVAAEITKRYGYYLGKGLAVVASVLNPEIFVLGGGVSKAGDNLIFLLKPSFKEYCFPGAADVRFALATLGNDAGMYGAAKLVL